MIYPKCGNYNAQFGVSNAESEEYGSAMNDPTTR